MERPLVPPTLISPPTAQTTVHLTAERTYDLLSTFLIQHTSKPTYAPSTQTSQLERLTDHVGLLAGLVDQGVADQHERERQEEAQRVKDEQAAAAALTSAAAEEATEDVEMDGQVVQTEQTEPVEEASSDSEDSDAEDSDGGVEEPLETK